MTLRDYMRADGWVAIAVGLSLCTFGLVHGHQGVGDAVVSGAIMVVGTGVFIAVRYRVPFRQPGAWFTSRPVARADSTRAACSRRRLLLALLADTIAFASLAVGVSYLTDFWLTYMDMGVWAVAIGAIKVGPATTAIVQCEAQSGAIYRVARRPLRGRVQATWD